MEKKVFEATLSNLRLMLSWLIENLESLSLKESDFRKIELSCEEALMNVIQHAYPEENGIVELVLSMNEKRVVIIIKDNGKPFNLLQVEEVNPSLPLEKRKEGGLGILLIKKNMDEVQYERHGKTNILTLIKKLQS